VLARVLGEAAARARSVSSGPAADLTRSLEREISRSVAEVLAAHDRLAGDLRSDIAMVMREIDAGGTALRAAIEAGDEELEGEVLAAFEALAAEFGDLAFMLGDLARAAGEVQDSLGGQAAELRRPESRSDGSPQTSAWSARNSRSSSSAPGSGSPSRVATAGYPGRGRR